MENYVNYPIGIDLGTTFSCIAVYRNGAVEIISNEIGERTTPSQVSFIDDEIFSGEETKYKIVKDPSNKIYSVKRIIGRNFDDEEVQEDIKEFSYNVVKGEKGKPEIIINKKGKNNYLPEEISAEVLKKLLKSAKEFLNQKIKTAVITVPAYFTESQKKATIKAGKIAGLEKIFLTNEPTAASLAYGFGNCNKKKKFNEKIKLLIDNRPNICSNSNVDINDAPKPNIYKNALNILVFDLGGGTLDVTILKLDKNEGTINVKNHNGKMHLGGEDFDNLLVKYFSEIFEKKSGINLYNNEYIKARMRLKEHCEKCKRDLSYRDESEIQIESLADGQDLNERITRAKFENICKSKFEECMEPIKDILSCSKLEPTDIDEIVLVGGSTKIPKIQEMLADYFEGKSINKSLDPDEAIAYGAAIECAIQMGIYQDNIVLLDACPFSLGIAVFDDIKGEIFRKMNKIIPKGKKIPCKIKKIFHPTYDNQTNVEIEVYEGENFYVKDNYFLGQFRLENLPKKKAKDVNIEVTFDLDENSILTVSAIDKSDKKENKITIQNDDVVDLNEELNNEMTQIAPKNENLNCDLGAAMSMDKNYKRELKNLFKEINDSKDQQTQYNNLLQFSTILELYLDIIINKDNLENPTLIGKIYYYLYYLFESYSATLKYWEINDNDTKDEIFNKINLYLDYLEKNGINYWQSLIQLFEDNDNLLFCTLAVKLLGSYSEKGVKLYGLNKKKLAKHYFEETLVLSRIMSIKERVEKIKDLNDSFNYIINNCNEMINIIKSELIEKFCPSFSKGELFNEEDFKDEEQKLALLDKFKDALRYVRYPKNKIDKILKASYIANIVKIEYKLFNSNDYITLLNMIDDCINLKAEAPLGCEQELHWFKEICNIKLEIEKKHEKCMKNPKADENKIKEDNKKIFEEIEDKSKDKFSFLFFILTNHKPRGITKYFIFDNQKELEKKYNYDPEKFLGNLLKWYNPNRYKGAKKEDLKRLLIMREIYMVLNNMDDE